MWGYGWNRRGRGGQVRVCGLAVGATMAAAVIPRLRGRVAGRGYAWRPEQDSNLRPLAPEASALSAELSGQRR